MEQRSASNAAEIKPAAIGADVKPDVKPVIDLVGDDDYIPPPLSPRLAKRLKGGVSRDAPIDLDAL